MKTIVRGGVPRSMQHMNEPQYLQKQQYRDSSNLDARRSLHEKYQTKKGNWYQSAYDHLSLTPGMRILEVGCGSAHFWLANLERLPEQISVTLTDFSAGMLDVARQALHRSTRFTFQQANAMELPFADASFDRVIAHHMLYHVPEKQKALQEFWRVLKPGGKLSLATNGANHMRQLNELMRTFFPAHQTLSEVVNSFTLENGGALLSQRFPKYERFDYPGELRVPESEPLLAYFRSMYQDMLDEQSLRQHIQDIIDRNGYFRCSTLAGLFLACKASFSV